MARKPTGPWFLYLIHTKDHTYYCGVTNNPLKRLREHTATLKGAKYLRGKNPLTLAILFSYPTFGQALVQERLVKRYTHRMKEALFEKATRVTLPNMTYWEPCPTCRSLGILSKRECTYTIETKKDSTPTQDP